VKIMSMRSQVYEWSNLATATAASTLRRTVDAVPQLVPINREYDIFIGGIGNNITKPAETTATQFIVIEDIACSAYYGGAIQVRINTTDYFQNPDVYVLPGQVFQILYSCTTALTGAAATNTVVVAAFVKYTLYDGPDALIANKLLELGVTINPNNVDWYKRTLIEQQQRSRVAATAANGGSA
jgi:hypothetical protein